ncbi:MAG: DUF3520 domain-containing protein [Opitutus sp.]|nr:DUF3520 domain-containing protein [Opitutus sp.]
MTHDDTKPNPDLRVAIEPELEARLIAWVAGEVSEFDRAELERRVAARPELANFKRRIELVRELLAEAVKPDEQPLRLSAERRAKLLKTLGADSAVLPLQEQVVVLPPPPSWWNGRSRRISFALAGVAVGGLAVLIQITAEYGAVRQVQQVADNDLRSAGRDAQLYAVALAREKAVSSALELASPKRRAERESVAISMLEAASGPVMSASTVEPPAPVIFFRNQITPGDEAKSKADFNAPAIAAGGKGGLATAGSIALGFDITAVGSAVTIGGAGGAAATGSRFLFKSTDSERLLENRDVAQTARVAALDSVVALSAFEVSAVKAEKKEAGATVASSEDSKQRMLALDLAGAKLAVAKIADKVKDADDRPANRVALPPPPVEETNAAKEPYSTFSLHVSDVSFRLAYAALLRGEMPDPSRIRPEEFYNAFNYGDPAPTTAEKIGARLEQAAHPFLQQRNLVRIAMKVPATGRGAGTPLRLTVLLDTSGSMEREDRAASVRRAMEVLVSLLTPNDRLTLIGFARQPRLLVENLAGDQARQVLDLIARLPAEGGTNLEAALKLGGELARRHQLAGAQNRIVVLTDGAANLGSADPAQLVTAIDTLRQQGIAFDACGVGLDGLDDAVLEALTRRGDGRYYVLNSPDAADAGFARQLAGAFRPAAENVKLQVRFNPARVGQYRLIGFEQHRLRTEDFRNNQVDAAELAADEAAVALYQIEVRPEGAGELGEVFVRFRDAATGAMVERSWAMPYDAAARAFDRATPSLQLAGTAALLAEKLRGGAAADPIKLRDLAPVVGSLRGHFPHEPRVPELVDMFAQLRRLGVE